jgi:hypothetical protein
MFLIPIRLVFGLTFTHLSSNLLSFLAPWMMIFDILINMNTGYYDKGNPVTNRGSIIMQYLKHHSITDMACVVPFIIYFFKYESYYSNSEDIVKKTDLSDFL